MVNYLSKALRRLQIILIWSPLAFAQDPTGRLQGQITDPSGASVPKAVVTVRNAETGLITTEQSARDGNFYFSFLAVGEYVLHITAPGFAVYDVPGIRVDVDRSVTLPVELSIATGSNTVEVIATGATVDVSTALGNVVSARARGLLFPDDPGVPAGIAPVSYREIMPRIGLAWDPTGSGRTAIRAAYGVFYDGYTNGVGGPVQAPVSALPWTEAYQLSGPGFNIADPYNGQQPPFVTGNYVRPATILTVQSGMLPPYSQNWNFSIQRTLGSAYLLDVRYVGNKGTHLPRFIEANPSIDSPGAISQNSEQRRLYANCDANDSCAFGSAGLIADNNSSTYHALQVALSRQFTHNLSFVASYWWSKSLDYVSSLNLSGSATTLVAGENDLAQNPFDLRAEHGPSLFDAANRFVLSGTYGLPHWQSAPKLASLLVNGWQLNTIVNLSSGTPFTVYDSANVSLQGSAPEITGFYSSRPNLISNPNAGEHTPNQWIGRAAFQQLNPVANAG